MRVFKNDSLNGILQYLAHASTATTDRYSWVKAKYDKKLSSGERWYAEQSQLIVEHGQLRAQYAPAAKSLEDALDALHDLKA